MRKILSVVAAVAFTATVAQADMVWINEIHYDNAGGDVGEGVEIAGPAGFDLSLWGIELYNGADQLSDGVTLIGQTIDDEGSGFGAVFLAITGLQNGAPDGLALVDDGGSLVSFLSYEGSFTALDGSATGVLSTDIGVAESSTTLIGESLQLTGTALTPANTPNGFTWVGPVAESPGTLNAGQTIVVPEPGTMALFGLGLLGLAARRRR